MKTLPDDFERARLRLRDEILNAHVQWQEMNVLFGDDEERIAFLNRTANWFFGMTSRALYRDLLVRLARLCDPPKSGQGARLTLDLLLRDPRVQARPALRDDLEKRLADVHAKAQPVVQHRHKNIAHLNRRVATSDLTVELPPVSPASISELLKAMQQLYNTHGGALYDSYMVFDFKPTKGALHLLEILEFGEAAWRKKWDLDR